MKEIYLINHDNGETYEDNYQSIIAAFEHYDDAVKFVDDWNLARRNLIEISRYFRHSCYKEYADVSIIKQQIYDYYDKSINLDIEVEHDAGFLSDEIRYALEEAIENCNEGAWLGNRFNFEPFKTDFSPDNEEECQEDFYIHDAHNAFAVFYLDNDYLPEENIYNKKFIALQCSVQDKHVTLSKLHCSEWKWDLLDSAAEKPFFESLSDAKIAVEKRVAEIAACAVN